MGIRKPHFCAAGTIYPTAPIVVQLFASIVPAEGNKPEDCGDDIDAVILLKPELWGTSF